MMREHACHVFLLDVPLPKQLDVRTRRCESCHVKGIHLTFPCHVEDVRQAIPHAVVHQSVRYNSIRYMTRDLLLTLLQNFYDVFNLRDVRRRLFAIAASVLRLEMMRGSSVPSPTTAAALALALPSAEEIQVIALRAFPTSCRPRPTSWCGDSACTTSLSFEATVTMI